MRPKGFSSTSLAIAAASVVTPCLAQTASVVDGGYNLAPLSLLNGQSAPLQLDRSGNLETDCVVGCSGAQGAPAASAGAWPVYLALGGVAVGAGNPLPVADTADGGAIASASMPAGGSGTWGWLSAIEAQLSSGTITVAPASGSVASVVDTNDGTASTTAQMGSNGVGILGWLSTIVVKLANTLSVSQVATGTVSDGSSTIGTSSTTAVAAIAGVRYRATLTNTSTASGDIVWCRADGGVAALNTGIALAANGGAYEWDYPLTGAKPAPAIDCLATTAAAVVATEVVE